MRSTLCKSKAEALAASIEVGDAVTVENNGSTRVDCE